MSFVSELVGGLASDVLLGSYRATVVHGRQQAD